MVSSIGTLCGSAGNFNECLLASFTFFVTLLIAGIIFFFASMKISTVTWIIVTKLLWSLCVSRDDAKCDFHFVSVAFQFDSYCLYYNEWWYGTGKAWRIQFCMIQSQQNIIERNFSTWTIEMKDQMVATMVYTYLSIKQIVEEWLRMYSYFHTFIGNFL